MVGHSLSFLPYPIPSSHIIYRSQSSVGLSCESSFITDTKSVMKLKVRASGSTQRLRLLKLLASPGPWLPCL